MQDTSRDGRLHAGTAGEELLTLRGYDADWRPIRSAIDPSPWLYSAIPVQTTLRPAVGRA